MAGLQTEDEKKLVGFLGNLSNDAGGYSYADMREDPPEGLGITNNTILKYKKEYSDVSLSDIDLENIRESYKEIELPEGIKSQKTGEEETEGSSSSTSSSKQESSQEKKQEAKQVDNLRTEVEDERKKKDSDNSSSKEGFEEADPTNKEHIMYVLDNTDLSSQDDAQKTLLNMRRDGVQIDTVQGEHKK